MQLQSAIAAVIVHPLCTDTVITSRVVLPALSVAVTAIVYTRPRLFPARSALRRRWCKSTICQSGAVSPSPVPFTGSLLVTLIIVVTGPQLSLTVYPTVISTILWFGGERTGLSIVKAARVGGVLSTTVTV